jgi:UDP-N-acetylglucosamine 2-epimerase (non-hydrolysing)
MTPGRRKKIACVVGTRPECIKMAPVIIALRAADIWDVVVLNTGQHRDLTRQALGLFGLEADVDLDVMAADQSLAGLSARILTRLDAWLAEEAPDLLLVQGDTTTVFVAALAAFYRRVPVGHVEAGLRTHDLRAPFPEEFNRVVTSLISAIHFAPTEGAKANLLKQGIAPDSIHVTGNTVIDALLAVAQRDDACDFPSRAGRRLILVTAHRRENFGQPIREICRALSELHDRFPDIEFVYPVHPNPNIRQPVMDSLATCERIHLLPPADYETLVGLMKNATLVLTDSGGIQEEAPALGKPVLVMREETERPEAVTAGVARLVGSDARRIVEATSRLLSDAAAYEQMARGVSPYGDGRAAYRIVEHCRRLLSIPADEGALSPVRPPAGS